MSPSWPDEVDEILGGDQAIALGYSTPARGVVVTPVTNFPIRDHWEPAGGPVPRNPLWRLWLRAFDTRVAITVAVERIVVWLELGCRGASTVHGTPLPADPPAPQRAPRGGTEPRIDHERAA